MDLLLRLDHQLFETINRTWANPLFDWLLPSITDLHRSPYFIVAMLPLIGLWIVKQRSYALKCLLALVLSIGASDLFSYRVIKSAVQRARPVEAGVTVQLRTHHHSGSSFPSNHTANMFAAAQLMTLAVPSVGPVFFLIAALIGLSRIYVGVHFPLDVAGGALLGITIASLVWLALRRWIKPSDQGREARP